MTRTSLEPRGCIRDERRCPRKNSTLVSSSAKESGSHVIDHGAEDEYVEVVMPRLLESTSELTVIPPLFPLSPPLLFLPNFGHVLVVVGPSIVHWPSTTTSPSLVLDSFLLCHCFGSSAKSLAMMDSNFPFPRAPQTLCAIQKPSRLLPPRASFFCSKLTSPSPFVGSRKLSTKSILVFLSTLLCYFTSSDCVNKYSYLSTFVLPRSKIVAFECV